MMDIIEYENLVNELKELKINLKDSYPDFVNNPIWIPNESIKELIDYIKVNHQCTVGDVVRYQYELEDKFLFKNRDMLKVTLNTFEEIDNHNIENRYFNWTIFCVDLIDIMLIYFFGQLYNCGYFASYLGHEVAEKIFSLDFDDFVEWMDSMYLTEKGYKYLEELKQTFKD